MAVFVSYITMLFFFIVAEIIVLSNVMQPLFKKHIGFLMNEETNFSIAAIFYLVYVAGVFGLLLELVLKWILFSAIFLVHFLDCWLSALKITNLVILKIGRLV